MRILRKRKVAWALSRNVVICSALAALMLARTAPSNLPHSSSALSTTSASNAHPHRPCLDREPSDWAAPAASYFPRPESTSFESMCAAIDLKLPFSGKGSHYNRPPPLG
jgi:hypothetical protein